MKILRLILLIARRGSWRQIPHNFAAERQRVISRVNLTSGSEPTGISQWKLNILKNPVGYMVMANLAFLRNARNMNNKYFISRGKKLIYLRILKCASTSMLRKFLPWVDNRYDTVNLSDEELDAIAYLAEVKTPGAETLKYRKFALVRNPFQRIVSVYLDLFDPDAPFFSYATFCFGVLSQRMSFKEFVKVIDTIPVSLLGPHFSPQWYIIENGPGLNQTSIYRIEKDMRSLSEFLDVEDTSLPYANKRSVDYDYRNYYDQETFGLVAKIYRQDVDIFGYEEERRSLEVYVKASTL
jgi:hypothetical protein